MTTLFKTCCTDKKVSTRSFVLKSDPYGWYSIPSVGGWGLVCYAACKAYASLQHHFQIPTKNVLRIWGENAGMLPTLTKGEIKKKDKPSPPLPHIASVPKTIQIRKIFSKNMFKSMRIWVNICKAEWPGIKAQTQLDSCAMKYCLACIKSCFCFYCCLLQFDGLVEALW